MRGKYDELRDQYPEYISLDQLHKICHIAKRSALYLVQHEIIPAIDTGKKTWRYKIAISDVITYLGRRERRGSMIPPGATSSRPASPQNQRTSFSMLVTPGNEKEVYRYFQHTYANYGDVLIASEIGEMTGLSHKTIMLLLKNGEIKSLINSPRYIVPKTCLLDFVASPRYINAKSNTESFKNVLANFEIWKSTCTTQHIKAESTRAAIDEIP